MFPKNRLDLKALIRFQLSQLSSKNAQHEFEHLAFELARLRIASNLLPATGPVQAGGDQGRDFESYKTYLSQTSMSNSSFLTLINDEILVGACTLDKKTSSKIKSDLTSIFGAGQSPTKVIYFSEPNIPVASRHKLQDFCLQEYKAILEIFDGQAITDMLAERDTFWIAEKFLSMPSIEWPNEPIKASDTRYMRIRKRWIDNNETPLNYADFLDIKEGLRTATFETDVKIDLPKWLELMGQFLETDTTNSLVQKVRYELIVAELRGRGSLDPAQTLLHNFFETLDIESSPAELQDAATLNLYISGAIANNHTTIAHSIIDHWKDSTLQIIKTKLDTIERRGDKCMLLEAQAMLGTTELERFSSIEEFSVYFYSLWNEVIGAVKITPLYPVTRLADILEALTVLLSETKGYREVVDKIDELVSQRAGIEAAAEKARRRAVIHLESEKYVLAIDELQRAKIGWFTGESVDSSILAMLVISQSFSALHLNIAARYYAAGALFLALNHENDEIKYRLPQAAFRLAETFLEAGEGVTFFYSVGQALYTHLAISSEPYQLNKHPIVERALGQAALLRFYIKRKNALVLAVIDNAISEWPIESSEQQQFIVFSGNGKQKVSQCGTEKLSHPFPNYFFPFSPKSRTQRKARGVKDDPGQWNDGAAG